MKVDVKILNISCLLKKQIHEQMGHDMEYKNSRY